MEANIYRDIRTTLITAAGLILALSVIEGWNWPVLGGSVRWGIIAVGAVSLFACSSSGWATDTRRTWYRDPLIIAAAVLGTITLLVGAAGLIVGTQPYLIAMMAGTVLLWLISTTRHLVSALAPPAGRLTTA